MGNKILKISLILMLLSFGVKAQDYVTTAQDAVIKGSKYTYRIEQTTGNNVTWKVDAGGTVGTAVVENVLGKTYSKVDITWTQTGTFQVTATEQSNPGNCPTESTFSVTVVEATSVDVTISSVFNPFCASNIAAADNFKGDFTVTGGVPPYSATITIKDQTTPTPQEFTKVVSSNNAGVFSIKGNEINNIANFKVNLGDGSYVTDLIISDVTDKYGAPIAIPAGKEKIQITIYRNPAERTIEHN